MQHLDHRGCFRHRDERERRSRDRLEDASFWMYFWNLEWICKKLVSPEKPPPNHTHTYTPLSKSLLEWQLPFLDQKKGKKKLLLEQQGKSKINNIRPTARKHKKKRKKKSSKHWNFLKTAVGDHSRKTVCDWGRGATYGEAWWGGGGRTGCFQDTVWRQFGMAIFSSECLSDSREYRCQEEP